MSTIRHLDGLEKALEHGGDGYSIGDVIRAIMSNRAQLWETEEAAIVTEVHDLPRVRVVHFWLATGELEAVIELSHRVLNWARSIGCERATLAGRKGWERVLAAEGWTPELTLMGRGV